MGVELSEMVWITEPQLLYTVWKIAAMSGRFHLWMGVRDRITASMVRYTYWSNTANVDACWPIFSIGPTVPILAQCSKYWLMFATLRGSVIDAILQSNIYLRYCNALILAQYKQTVYTAISDQYWQPIWGQYCANVASYKFTLSQPFFNNHDWF